MKMHTLFIVVLALLLSACAGKQPVREPAPTPLEVRGALKQPTPERQVSALKSLQGGAWPEERVIDLQTLVTLTSLKIETAPTETKTPFQVEADILGRMVAQVSAHKVPQDTAVLLTLAGKAQSGMLGYSAQTTLDKFCAPDNSLTGGGGGDIHRQAEIGVVKALANACHYFVQGDWKGSNIELSEALRLQVSAEKLIVPQEVKPSIHGGWDIFQARFEQMTGIGLQASASRLQQ